MAHHRVAILGASGFAGAELLRRLLVHPGVEVVRVCADDHLGEPVSRAHPHLEGMPAARELRFEEFEVPRAVSDVDVVLMGLPPQPSFEVMRAVKDRDVRVIDMSGAFRMHDPELFERFYGRKHPLPELLREFVYGLPEENRGRIRSARWVASPGCFATTITLGLLPLARAGLLNGNVHTVAMTGSSGAGKVPLPTTHHPVRAHNVRTYKGLCHPHEPEVAETLRLAAAAAQVATDPRSAAVVPEIEAAEARGASALRMGAPMSLSFVPVAGPFVRGILATSFVHLPRAATVADVRTALHATYDGEPFVRLPEGREPEVIAVAGSCFSEVGLIAAPAQTRSGEAQPTAERPGDAESPCGGELVVLVSALDNLIKGGAGQAVQNLNLMLGFDETTTLVDPGPYP